MDDVELSRLTIGALLDRQAEQFGDRECVAYHDRDFRLTYRQFRDRVDLVGRGLMALGVRKAEHVAVWAPNIPEWLLLQYATAKIGAVLVPIETGCRVDELEYMLRSSETTTLLLASSGGEVDFLSVLHAMLPGVDESPVGHGRFENLPRLQRLLSIGHTRFAGMLRFDDLFDLAAQTHVDDYRRRCEAHSSFEVINLRYTSGTPGSRKGVMLAHRNILHNASRVTDRMRLTENDRVCAAIPFFDGLGATTASVGALLRGACVVPIERIEPLAALEAASKERCTAICAMPQLFFSVLAYPERFSFATTDLRTGVVGGSPFSPGLVHNIIESLGIEEMTSVFGVTEASVITQTSPDDPLEKRIETVGRVLPGMQVKIVDPKSGETKAPGLEGELCCRGHSVMKGYFKDPEATADVIDADGWLHTRELAVADHGGYVRIVGWPRDSSLEDVAKAQTHEIGRRA